MPQTCSCETRWKLICAINDDRSKCVHHRAAICKARLRQSSSESAGLSCALLLKPIRGETSPLAFWQFPHLAFHRALLKRAGSKLCILSGALMLLKRLAALWACFRPCGAPASFAVLTPRRRLPLHCAMTGSQYVPAKASSVAALSRASNRKRRARMLLFHSFAACSYFLLSQPTAPRLRFAMFIFRGLSVGSLLMPSIALLTSHLPLSQLSLERRHLGKLQKVQRAFTPQP